MSSKDLIVNRIKENSGYITTKDLKGMNINRFYISELEKEGVIERIKRGIYRDSEYIPENELIEINKMIPKGVVCLDSAIEYYGLTTQIPNVYKIAIPRNSKVSIPDYPPIKIIYFSDTNYKIGISEIQINGSIIKMYDIEKTVCDIARYRNKIGKDVFYEVLKEYMKKDYKDITKLLEYAKMMNIYNVLKNALEVLI